MKDEYKATLPAEEALWRQLIWKEETNLAGNLGKETHPQSWHARLQDLTAKQNRHRYPFLQVGLSQNTLKARDRVSDSWAEANNTPLSRGTVDAYFRDGKSLDRKKPAQSSTASDGVRTANSRGGARSASPWHRSQTPNSLTGLPPVARSTASAQTREQGDTRPPRCVSRGVGTTPMSWEGHTANGTANSSIRQHSTGQGSTRQGSTKQPSTGKTTRGTASTSVDSQGNKLERRTVEWKLNPRVEDEKEISMLIASLLKEKGASRAAVLKRLKKLQSEVNEWSQPQVAWSFQPKPRSKSAMNLPQTHYTHNLIIPPPP
mmetsp:Transcript_27165/g.62636  ORF Transcript_27165/g.62636 Transcript_27165/m.62636 type:complete len:318 (+) Transcript_27165:23-976(+)